MHGSNEEHQERHHRRPRRGMNVDDTGSGGSSSSSRGRSCHRPRDSPERRRSLTPCGRPPGLTEPRTTAAEASANNSINTLTGAATSVDASRQLLRDLLSDYCLQEEEELEAEEAAAAVDRREQGGAELPGVTAVTSTARPGQSGQCRPARGTTRSGARSTIPARGPPPAPPRKLDYKRPAMTRAMLAKLKHTQKLQEELERRECERRERDRMPPPLLPQRRPQQQQAAPGPTSRRCDGPSVGDVQQRATRRCPAPVAGTKQQQQQQRPVAKLDATQCPQPPPPSQPPAQPSRSRPGISNRTRNLAKTMNADIVQAEPLEKGTIDNIIIPPGAINADKTTIVSLPQPEAIPAGLLPSSTRVDHATTSAGAGGCGANKSAQVIAESLDEQEAAEAAVVNCKLQHLQQARRDFVMSVADVGGTAISLEPLQQHVSDISAPGQLSGIDSPKLYRCPSLDDPYLRPECGRDHPHVMAARDYLQDKRFDDMFARYAADREEDGYDQEDDFLDQEFLDSLGPIDLIDLDDEQQQQQQQHVNVDYCAQHRDRRAIPRRRAGPEYEVDNDMDRLQKFCDPGNYPNYRPSPPRRRSHHQHQHNHHRHRRRGDVDGCRAQPPPGRENLPEDLWDLQDPWANNCPEQQRDLMDFSKDDNC